VVEISCAIGATALSRIHKVAYAPPQRILVRLLQQLVQAILNSSKTLVDTRLRRSERLEQLARNFTELIAPTEGSYGGLYPVGPNDGKKGTSEANRRLTPALASNPYTIGRRRGSLVVEGASRG